MALMMQILKHSQSFTHSYCRFCSTVVIVWYLILLLNQRWRSLYSWGLVLKKLKHLFLACPLSTASVYQVVFAHLHGHLFQKAPLIKTLPVCCVTEQLPLLCLCNILLCDYIMWWINVLKHHGSLLFIELIWYLMFYFSFYVIFNYRIVFNNK